MPYAKINYGTMFYGTCMVSGSMRKKLNENYNCICKLNIILLINYLSSSKNSF